jgi:hypothetical protein
MECLSLIILTPANFWKTLTDILKKPKVEFNLKKILNKLHHNLKAFNMEKSEKSWNIIFELMKSQDWSTTSFDAQTASKLGDLFVQYTDEHITETRRAQYSSDSIQNVRKCLTSTSSTAARGQGDHVDAPSYEISPLSIGSLITPNLEHMSHSNTSEIFSTIFTVEAEGRPIPGRGKRIFPLTFVSRPALRHTQNPEQWVPGVLSSAVKRGRGVTLTTHHHLVPRSRMSRSYNSSPPKRLRGV